MKDGAAWYSNLRKKRRSRIKIVTYLKKNSRQTSFKFLTSVLYVCHNFLVRCLIYRLKEAGRYRAIHLPLPESLLTPFPHVHSQHPATLASNMISKFTVLPCGLLDLPACASIFHSAFATDLTMLHLYPNCDPRH